MEVTASSHTSRKIHENISIQEKGEGCVEYPLERDDRDVSSAEALLGLFLLTERKEIQNLFAPFAFAFIFLLCMEMQCLLVLHLDAGARLARRYG